MTASLDVLRRDFPTFFIYDLSNRNCCISEIPAGLQLARRPITNEPSHFIRPCTFHFNPSFFLNKNLNEINILGQYACESVEKNERNFLKSVGRTCWEPNISATRVLDSPLALWRDHCLQMASALLDSILIASGSMWGKFYERQMDLPQ